MQAIHEIGGKRFLRFFIYILAEIIFRFLIFPPLRVWYLRLWGAKIGRGTVLMDVHFFNMNLNGYRNLHIGENCFIGNECLIDLADQVIFEDQVTLAERVVVMTHLNVGYQNHPLQKFFPKQFQAVRIRQGCFVGSSATILAGVEIGPTSFVAAGAVVSENVPAKTLVGGVPAKVLKKVEDLNR
jgi:acetyltransferase-like isoleucine patch superfamily enzyme